MSVIFNLDEEASNLETFHLVEDLTYPFSVLDATFRAPASFDPAAQPEFHFLNHDWKVLTGQVQTNMQAHQVVVRAYQREAFVKVSKSLLTSSDLKLQLKMPVAAAGFTSLKFETPVKGDTYAAVMNALVYQSFEENVNSIRNALCLSATTQGLFATTWHSLGTVKGIFDETSSPVLPEIFFFRDQGDYILNHTVKPNPETQASYYNRLFGSKLEVNCQTLLSLGVSYTFNTEILGYKQEKPLILLRQELTQRQGISRPVKQLFVEVQNV